MDFAVFFLLFTFGKIKYKLFHESVANNFCANQNTSVQLREKYVGKFIITYIIGFHANVEHSILFNSFHKHIYWHIHLHIHYE